METKPSNNQFVRLTYTTLSRTDLTLSEKIILDYRNGFPKRYWAGHDHVSEVLGIPLKTVKNCITSLRKKGLWKEPDHRPKKGLVSPKKGLVTTSLSPKMGSEESLNEVNKNPVLPMGNGVGLDSDKIENPEESLERTPTVVGLENTPQTSGLKNDSNQSQPSYSIGVTEINKDTSTLGDDYPRDSTGRRLTKNEMIGANFDALFEKNTLSPYSDEQVRRGLDE
jgi:hypothetical protein